MEIMINFVCLNNKLVRISLRIEGRRKTLLCSFIAYKMDIYFVFIFFHLAKSTEKLILITKKSTELHLLVSISVSSYCFASIKTYR